jgi:hypothetical protein
VKASTQEAGCFEVLDALGLCRLTRRTGDLDGAVPLRVAKACVPLLEGNAFGLQITLRRPLEIRRRLGALTILALGDDREALFRAHRAALPRLVAQGFLAEEGAWHRALRDGFAFRGRGSLGRPRLRLWTGLLVRPDPGLWLRVASAANRRNLLIEVSEAYLSDDGAFIPLIVELGLTAGAPARLRLEGEIGCLAPVLPDVQIEARSLAEVPEVGRAHADFYDASYFAAKKGQVTRKYRRLVGRADAEPETRVGAPRCLLVAAGPVAPEITEVAEVTTAAGPDPVARAAGQGRLASVVVRNAVSFRASFDGLTLAIDPDARTLAEGAEAVTRSFGAVYGEDFLAAHRGALWYLTKYFTPHPPGEPHFFVKPWAFFQTAPGWSSLLEGVHGDGYDVMRGVVETDVFFATPAVFHVHRIGAPIEVPSGAPLLRVLPIPRSLLGKGFREVRFRDG